MGTGFVRMPDGNEIRVPKAQTEMPFGATPWKWSGGSGASAPRRARQARHEAPSRALRRDRDARARLRFEKASDQRIHTDFFIPARHLGGATEGDKVLVTLEQWDDPRDQPIGRVVQVLGQEGEHEVEMHAILAEFGLPYQFPAEVEEAAKAFQAE